MSEDLLDRNHLTDAASPYLRQHADNPVHWQVWSAPVLALARTRDVPILLSIGYSACHWCHVMAHECFENAAIAARMNAGFVNIKLDRERRPDIDQVYQLAFQAFHGRGGGWPLTVFLDPQDLSPFYVGTYFPPHAARGLPGFAEVLARVREHFDTQRTALRAQSGQLQTWLRQAARAEPAPLPDAESVGQTACAQLQARFDRRWGGTQGAPKFPRPAELAWLLACGRRDAEAAGMATHTLAVMARRGLRDHIGGGFFRYCVDADWSIPHFEKMLYDNAQLLALYARLAAVTEPATPESKRARQVVAELVAWLRTDMHLPGGGLASALDADSAGGEGAYYVWTPAQMRAVLSPDQYALAELAWGLDGPANFEGRAWHLLQVRPWSECAALLGRSEATLAADVAGVRARLQVVRAQRPAPGRDDKCLTAGNALAVSALARAARWLADADCAQLAQDTLENLRSGAWREGRLAADQPASGLAVAGFLEDHALLLDALLEMLQLDFRRADLVWAQAVAEALLERFAVPGEGGFTQSAADHATPLLRPRSWMDDALPNGNAMAIVGLLRLGHLVGEERYLHAAEQALHAGAGALARYPSACPTLLRALVEWQCPRTQVVIRCHADAALDWRDAVAGLVPPGALDVYLLPAAADLPGLLQQRTDRGGAGTAYLCRGLTCQAPITDPARLRQHLAAVDG